MVDAKPVRKYSRIPSSVAISISSVSDTDQKVLGLGKNISVGGCMFLCCEPLMENQLIQVDFGVGFERVNTLARVSHTRPAENSLHQIGIEFFMLHPEDMTTLERFCNAKKHQPPEAAGQTAIAEVCSFSDKA